jgi:predicted nucleic acid-binding protein
LEALDDDFEQGRYVQADLLWRAALDRAAELSRTFSRKFGTRSLDVIHVASALEMKFRSFVTFDRRQQNLAKAVGLKVVAPRVP